MANANVHSDASTNLRQEDPRVSFVVPAHNEADQLPATLRAIRHQETVVPFEVIVVDGGSDDDTVHIAEEFGVRVVRQEGTGIGSARHQGAQAARGEWLAFVDADTAVDPRYVVEMLTFVRERDLVGASSRCRVRGGLRTLFPQFVMSRVFPRSTRPILPGFNTFVRRDAYDAIGGYENVPNEDKAFSRDLATVGVTAYHPDVLVETSGRRIAEQGLVGMSWHYLKLDVAAINHDEAGDRLDSPVLGALVGALVLASLQFYHAFALDHWRAALAGVGFVGGAILFMLDVSRQRIFLYGIAFLLFQVADWVAGGADHGTFGAMLYGAELGFAGLLAYDWVRWRGRRPGAVEG